MSYVLILGAGSDIAAATAKKYASEGFDIYLAGRNEEELKKSAEDLKIRFEIDAQAKYFDALDYRTHQQFYDGLDPAPGIVICVFGYLGDHEKAKRDFDEAANIIDTNYKGAVSILNIAADDFFSKQKGSIVGISSVAGDRGRGSNYYYGSAKAGFTEYLSGLRNRLYKNKVNVTTVKPGFVYTKMTEGMKLPGALTAKPEKVAKDIFKAERKGKNVKYSKGMWRLIMLIIIHIPESIFKRLSM